MLCLEASMIRHTVILILVLNAAIAIGAWRFLVVPAEDSIILDLAFLIVVAIALALFVHLMKRLFDRTMANYLDETELRARLGTGFSDSESASDAKPRPNGQEAFRK
jgi:membrane protein YdbS with pleckstrin-like domain